MIGPWFDVPEDRYTCTTVPCSNLSCADPSTAEVLVGATWLPKCFTHEREYADRYHGDGIRSLP
jgi:hypothetical protein